VAKCPDLSIVKAAEKMPSIEGNGTIIRPEAGRGTDAAGGKSVLRPLQHRPRDRVDDRVIPNPTSRRGTG
jgi:hypothetical protein